MTWAISDRARLALWWLLVASVSLAGGLAIVGAVA